MQFLLASLISLLLLQAALALPAPVATNKSLQQRFSATSKSILARDGAIGSLWDAFQTDKYRYCPGNQESVWVALRVP
ncbi:hypothetical protein PCANC_08827 [Puccinia coronata f. sp. avenae]|uniref:Uncharacterized protein n=1 Tax=Puccinia coronata f. sp. avenae TaxID=200324 RepID=A0A2N5SYV6_9BASI|nr:hypothetical protein PCANC_08827 [Puccinia coronata f. sp. avenae]